MGKFSHMPLLTSEARMRRKYRSNRFAPAYGAPMSSSAEPASQPRIPGQSKTDILQPMWTSTLQRLPRFLGAGVSRPLGRVREDPPIALPPSVPIDLSSLMFVDVHCRKPCAFCARTYCPRPCRVGITNKENQRISMKIDGWRKEIDNEGLCL